MCMFEILPSRPEVTGTLEEELQKKLGAGAWGVTLGHCGEVAVFYMNKERMNPRCESYFVQREEDLKKTPFIIDIDKLKQKAARLNQVRTVMIQQTVATVVFGLTVPLLIAFFWWRKKALLKFPKGFAMLLTVPSFVASFLGPAFLLNLVGKGISASGDNPSAIAGIMFGFMILIPAYWISIGLLFFAMKRTQSRAKTV